jgi:hypothetical protein
MQSALLMSSQDKYEHAKFVIERYDHYFDTVNNKGAFYIGLNTFLLGGLFAGFIALHEKVSKPYYLWVLLILFAICNLISSIITILAIHPYVNTSKKSAKKSLMFFGSVATYDREIFGNAFMQQDQQHIGKDTVTQVWFLARGLTIKFRRLKFAGYLIIVQFFILIPIIYSIIKNLLTHEYS